MCHAELSAIEYFLPAKSVSNADLAAVFPEWSSRTASRIGIEERRIAAQTECASDLAVAAAKRLFCTDACRPEDIDFILLCTQSPDYVLPTTACLLQERLGISTSAGALDFNLGCSGFVYGLGLAEGLIASGQARAVLLVTAETYSKYIKRDDLVSRAVFGDGAAATFIKARDSAVPSLGPFVYGTDGRGARNLIVPDSGARRLSYGTENGERSGPLDCESPALFMDGNSVFQFAVSSVPTAVQTVLTNADLRMEDIDLFVFHQANAVIVREISANLMIPLEKVQITLSNCGNTVSSTIPIALKHAQGEGRLKSGSIVLVAGFGVGYSWAAGILRWQI